MIGMLPRKQGRQYGTGRKYGTLVQYAFFVMVRVRYVSAVGFKSWTEVWYAGTVRSKGRGT